MYYTTKDRIKKVMGYLILIGLFLSLYGIVIFIVGNFIEALIIIIVSTIISVVFVGLLNIAFNWIQR